MRAALLLAAPASTLPDARLSMTFAEAPGGHFVSPDGTAAPVLTVQGEADHEYFFLHDAAIPPLSEAVLGRAQQMLAVVDAARRDPPVSAALSALERLAAPTLSMRDQLTLAVAALEALLLPEVRADVTRTFADRVSSLLAIDAGHAAGLKACATALYRMRSDTLHGATAADAAGDPLIARRAAQQLLAAAIQRRAASGAIAPHRVPIDLPEGAAGEFRLGPSRPRTAGVWASDVDMSGPKDSLYCWAPLVGLGIEQEFGLRTDPPLAVMMTLTGAEAVVLEEKDIRRDFIAPLYNSSEVASTLGIWLPFTDNDDYETTAARLRRSRDLAVSALRVSGYGAFVDPELLGDFHYWGSLRFRRPTVLRQTILQRLQRPPLERIALSAQDGVLQRWRQLRVYDTEARHPQVDHALALFRRCHDELLMTPQARAAIAFASLEAMLGRFRRPRAHGQASLEALVTACAGTLAAARWFAQDGRSFRNAVAHGRWDAAREGEEPLEYLIVILRAVVPAYVSAWMTRDPALNQSPGEAAVITLAGQPLT